MSVSYWVAKKFGVLITLFYIAVMGILVVSYYRAGMSDAAILAQYYPAGRSYESSDKYQKVREIYGFPAEIEEKLRVQGGVDVLSYTDDGAVIQRSGKNQETVSTNDAIKYLANRNSSQIENYVRPLEGPLSALLDLHLKFMQRVEQAAGGEEDGIRKMVVPKAVVSVVYLGLVLVVLYILKRVDKASKGYQGGFSYIYASFAFWPVAIIAVSFAGTNVVDVVRHLPDSYFFLRGYVVGAWAAMFAWPLFVALLSILDIVHAVLRGNLNMALAHAGVLAAGLVSIPLVTVGVLFAILLAVMYIGYKMTKRMMPASIQKRLP